MYAQCACVCTHRHSMPISTITSGLMCSLTHPLALTKVPLLLSTIPAPAEFRRAVQSLSPEQMRFAKAYRSCARMHTYEFEHFCTLSHQSLAFSTHSATHPSIHPPTHLPTHSPTHLLTHTQGHATSGHSLHDGDRADQAPNGESSRTTAAQPGQRNRPHANAHAVVHQGETGIGWHLGRCRYFGGGWM